MSRLFDQKCWQICKNDHYSVFQHWRVKKTNILSVKHIVQQLSCQFFSFCNETLVCFGLLCCNNNDIQFCTTKWYPLTPVALSRFKGNNHWHHYSNPQHEHFGKKVKWIHLTHCERDEVKSLAFSQKWDIHLHVQTEML